MEELDTTLFFWINSWELSEWLNTLLIYWRNPGTWLPLYVILSIALIYFLKKNAILIIILAVITTGFVDFTNSRLLKFTFERPRPCHTFSKEEGLNLRVTCGSGYSLPSSHAANHFALANFLILAIGAGRRKYFLWLFPWAILVGISQVYVGVHYPADILFGFLWGAMISLAMYRLFKLINGFFFAKESL
jgi:membrane-associated phospholipid phosphatase